MIRLEMLRLKAVDCRYRGRAAPSTARQRLRETVHSTMLPGQPWRCR